MSFRKYNLSSSYETFIFYEEVSVGEYVYYIHFSYAGYNEPREMLGMTFLTNLSETYGDSRKGASILLENVKKYCSESDVPVYMLDGLIFNVTRACK